MVEWLKEAQEELKNESFSLNDPFKELDVKEAVMQDNEVFLALIGRQFAGWWYGVSHWAREGAPARVHFDPALIQQREESRGDIIGFFHTHPSFSASPSQIDYATMGAWTTSFGKPLLCSIEGTDGLRAHWFVDDESEPVETLIRRYGNIFIGKCPKLER